MTMIPYGDDGAAVDVSALHVEIDMAILAEDASATCTGVTHDPDPLHCPADSAIKIELSATPSPADQTAIDAAVAAHLGS